MEEITVVEVVASQATVQSINQPIMLYRESLELKWYRLNRCIALTYHI